PVTLPATGAAGAASPVQPFLGLPVFDPSPIPAPNPVFSNIAIFATESISMGTRVASQSDLWSNGDVSMGGNGVFNFTGDIVAGGDVSIGGSDSTNVTGNIMAHRSVSLNPRAVLPEVVDPNAEMSMAPTERTILNIIGDLEVGAGAAITSGSANRGNRFKVFVQNPANRVEFGSGSLFHGTLIAPTASVEFGARSAFVGAVYARTVDLGCDASFAAHMHPTEAPLPSVPAGTMASSP